MQCTVFIRLYEICGCVTKKCAVLKTEENFRERFTCDKTNPLSLKACNGNHYNRGVYFVNTAPKAMNV